MKSARRLLAATVLLAAAAVGSHAAGPVYPEHTGYVTDATNTLGDAARQRLVELIRRLHDRTAAQVAVAIVPTTEGEAIDTYAAKLFEKWKVGTKGKDNGVLFVAAIKDRKMRIEVGYGLEGALPDGKTGEILRTVVRPRFQAGDMAGGVIGGVEAIVTVIAGEYKVPPAELGLGAPVPTQAGAPAAVPVESGSGTGFWIVVLGIGIAVVGLGSAIFSVVKSIVTRSPGSRTSRGSRASSDSWSSSSDWSSSSSSSDSSSSSSSSDSFDGGSSGGGGASSDW